MTKTAIHTLKRQNLFIFLIGLTAIFLMVYGYMLNATILDGVHIERGEKRLGELNSRVSGLEQQYFEAKSGVTLSLAHSLGFADAGVAIYISRSEQNGTLSLRDEN